MRKIVMAIVFLCGLVSLFALLYIWICRQELPLGIYLTFGGVLVSSVFGLLNFNKFYKSKK